ncbi:response regulator [Lachnospiraceae bacterium NSJ-143]|nr:response regulator [Lachnospiraceae bacterium NSJ-143]
MKKYKKHSIIILVSIIFLLFSTVVFMLSLLNQITLKMNQGSNETMMNLTRIIHSSINSQFSNDEQQLDSSANLFVLSGGAVDPAETLDNYAKSTEFFKYYYIDKSGYGIDGDGNAVDVKSLPFKETALSNGIRSYSEAYTGSSGRLQITFQTPVYFNGSQIGALYADKTLLRYNNPALFTFSGGNGNAYVVNGDDGSWIIESTGSKTDGIYEFLEQNSNSPEVLDSLRNLMSNGQAGTIKVKLKGNESIMCFLPMENSYNWYLLSVMPKSILQRESSEIIKMVNITFIELTAALILITVLLLGRENMKGREQRRIYRERLFQNISANIDFAFLIYSPSNRSVEMVSNNVMVMFDIESEQALSNPELLFDKCGMPQDDKGRNDFFNGELNKKILQEYKTGENNELQRWTQIHLIPADDGQYLAVFHDTTSEHHMRDDLADALQQSQENNRARTSFFSSMSHDIRTPMNGIIGMTAIARANLDNPEKVKDSLNKISIASDNLLALINEVLDMSRIESGKFCLKKEPVNLPELISNVLLVIKPDLAKKGHTMKIRSSALDYDTVLGDALHIQKILMNILSNAIKYTPEGGKIFIHLEEKQRKDNMIDIVFEVEDNGIGMEPEFVERIFSPFERAEDNRLSKIAGTGLGMAITKNIVDTMGGTINVESKIGAGSKFTVVLPMQLSETNKFREDALAGNRILVVDDSVDACEAIEAMLEDVGVQVDWALSGVSALEAVNKAHLEGNDYFAVILDWKMPNMDGIETAMHIREDIGEEIPIILLSAYNWEDVEQDALKAGINGFLTKPIFRSELIQKLHFYMTGSDTKVNEDLKQVLQHDFKGLRVLLAEDNELNREIAVELLNNAGIEVDSVENGLLAVERMKKSQPGYYGMIFMDIHMPVMDGIAATRNIRNLSDRGISDIPIIAMTADAFDDDIARCRNAGMNAHISKPVNIDKMFEVIWSYWQKNGGAENDN